MKEQEILKHWGNLVPLWNYLKWDNEKIEKLGQDFSHLQISPEYQNHSRMRIFEYIVKQSNLSRKIRSSITSLKKLFKEEQIKFYEIMIKDLEFKLYSNLTPEIKSTVRNPKKV